jgi:plasmid maintenance system antidote protein VapI
MAKRRTKAGPETLSDQLRRIIADSGLSRYAICKAAGIDPAHLHRFVNNQHGGRLTNDTIDKLGVALKLRLVQDE